MTTLQIVGNWLLVLAAIPAIVSPFVHAKTPWRASVMGTHLMFYMTSLALVFGLTVVDIMIRPDPAWFQILQVVTFVGVPIVMWWRLILQIQALRHPLARSTREGPSDDTVRN